MARSFQTVGDEKERKHEKDNKGEAVQLDTFYTTPSRRPYQSNGLPSFTPVSTLSPLSQNGHDSVTPYVRLAEEEKKEQNKSFHEILVEGNNHKTALAVTPRDRDNLIRFVQQTRHDTIQPLRAGNYVLGEYWLAVPAFIFALISAINARNFSVPAVDGLDKRWFDNELTDDQKIDLDWAVFAMYLYSQFSLAINSIITKLVIYTRDWCFRDHSEVKHFFRSFSRVEIILLVSTITTILPSGYLGFNAVLEDYRWGIVAAILLGHGRSVPSAFINFDWTYNQLMHLRDHPRTAITSLYTQAIKDLNWLAAVDHNDELVGALDTGFLASLCSPDDETLTSEERREDFDAVIFRLIEIVQVTNNIRNHLTVPDEKDHYISSATRAKLAYFYKKAIVIIAAGFGILLSILNFVSGLKYLSIADKELYQKDWNYLILPWYKILIVGLFSFLCIASPSFLQNFFINFANVLKFIVSVGQTIYDIIAKGFMRYMSQYNLIDLLLIGVTAVSALGFAAGNMGGNVGNPLVDNEIVKTIIENGVLFGCYCMSFNNISSYNVRVRDKLFQSEFEDDILASENGELLKRYHRLAGNVVNAEDQLELEEDNDIVVEGEGEVNLAEKVSAPSPAVNRKQIKFIENVTRKVVNGMESDISSLQLLGSNADELITPETKELINTTLGMPSETKELPAQGISGSTISPRLPRDEKKKSPIKWYFKLFNAENPNAGVPPEFRDNSITPNIGVKRSNSPTISPTSSPLFSSALGHRRTSLLPDRLNLSDTTGASHSLPRTGSPRSHQKG